MENPGKGRGKMRLNTSRGKKTAEPSREDWIGRQLRRVYDEAASEPLPDDLRQLLEEMDRRPQERQKPS